jgi:hypothetical protein
MKKTNSMDYEAAKLAIPVVPNMRRVGAVKIWLRTRPGAM